MIKWGGCGGGEKRKWNLNPDAGRQGRWRRGKVLANAGSAEEVGSLASSLPFSGLPGRNFRGKA